MKKKTGRLVFGFLLLVWGESTLREDLSFMTKIKKSIASQLSINISTVRKHLENIYQKLGVQSRTEAIAQALTKLGFL
jgi:predicted ArsR family transcriptional regulator